MQTIPLPSGNLIVSRRAGESLHIGSTIEVLILAVGTDVVRLEVMTRGVGPTALDTPVDSRLISCRLQQSVSIAACIELSLARVRGRQARIAIKAPRDVPVLRSELQA